MEVTDGIHHLVRIQEGVLIVGIVIINEKSQCPGLPFRKTKTLTTFEDEERPVGLHTGLATPGADVLGWGEDVGAVRTLREGIVAFHEAPRAPDHEKAHQLTPVIRMFALLEGREGVHGALVAPGELVDAAVALGS